MLEKAVRICDAAFGNIYRWDGEVFQVVAMHNTPPAFAELRRRTPYRPDSGHIGRVVTTKSVVHVVDVAAGDNESLPATAAAVELGGARTALLVPMLKDDQLIGAISLLRQEVRPFTEKQITLVTTFAAQAVIAIENARLLNELRQRTADLTEALEQQTATADVLRIISSSPTEIGPVLDAIVRTAGELCASEYAMLFRLRDGKYHVAASNNAEAEFVKHFLEHPITLDRGSVVGRTALERHSVHIVDCLADPEYKMLEAASLGKHRTLLGVPLLRDGEAIGVIGLLRTSVKPFTQKQIELVENFSDQAVIAIENARLFNELRQSLEQQTATSEVLQTISSSPSDVEPVFVAMLEKAVRICDAKFGNIYRWDGKALHLVSSHNTPPAFAEARSHSPHRPAEPSAEASTSVPGRMATTKSTIHVADLAADPAYVERHPQTVAAVELGGVRTLLAVPMLKEGELIGAFALSRQEVRPFTDKQIALVTNFARQAVIAIENARLLNELRQSLEQQTAAAEVLQVVSSSPGHLEPVFAAMLGNAARLCDAKFGNIFRWDGEALRLAATHNTPPAFAEARARTPLRPNQANPIGHMLANQNTIHISDLAADARYAERTDPDVIMAVELGGIRTFVAVPMVKEKKLIGTLILYRQEVRPFTNKQIELLENFAAQAVIAIENARLLNELRERTAQLEVQSQEVAKLNQQLERRVADQVGEIERMGRLRRFLPPQVADLIVASGAEKQLESHRREITALFCDLRGFTGFSESADPEDVMALLRDYHAAIGKIIIKYSGTLERYAGDGVMVVFNDPVPVEKPALQAVLMALEMREVIGTLTEKWRRLGHDIGFGIGIAHGFATLGTIGFEGRFDYAAIGTVANVASRLCDEAKPGQILISPRVLMAVEDAVTVEPVGEFALKGIRRPLAAYNVLAAASERA